MVAYGEGLADINLRELVTFHRSLVSSYGHGSITKVPVLEASNSRPKAYCKFSFPQPPVCCIRVSVYAERDFVSVLHRSGDWQVAPRRKHVESYFYFPCDRKVRFAGRK
jgi:hypothetical protein